jgi:4-aminobutyrate aminotransferase-like enzyme
LNVAQEKYRILTGFDGPYKNVLRIKPPMCFNKRDVDELVGALDQVLTTIENPMRSKL